MTALHDLAATELVALYGSGELSPVDVTRAVLDRIAAWEPHLHATYALDADAALAAARASEARWQRGAPLGAIDGVPSMIKENIATEGTPTPLGTAATILAPAAHDAPPAARMREAGAVILGKTTMPDYGMLSSGLSSFHALARNPWDLSKGPGGSSAGAGAGVAAGYGPLHIGTDIGGSLRLPAAWCGIFTLKMSLPAQAIEWSRLERAVRGLKIGLLLDAGAGLPVDPEIAAAVRAAADRFTSAGAHVESIAPFFTRAMLDGMDSFWRLRSWLDYSALPAERQAKVLPFIVEWLKGGAGLSGEQAFRGYSQMGAMRDAALAAHRPFDIVLSPTAPITAFRAELASPTDDPMRPLEHIAFTVPYNMSEQPAASINCGWTRAGLPIGLQIAGKRHDDLGVLQVARAWEVLRPTPRPWPEPPVATR
jgi:aspartyl-tRNA(Asn)/glutamyl-tRNA(Gln) amidotransferase subunit A